eukprot:CCRYP_015325-RA/>CCRYP_015325-RA protein AED:0.00 eAED:0.00 QI:61/1/1/1/0/0/2/50/35
MVGHDMASRLPLIVGRQGLCSNHLVFHQKFLKFCE